MNKELATYLTPTEIEAICVALNNYKHILLDGDLKYGSTYFHAMTVQREKEFNALIDKVKKLIM